MNGVKTKAELLERMSKLGACQDATEYVQSHPSDSAREIWETCPRADWLQWYAAREDRAGLVRCARLCADRAKGHAADTDADAAAYADADAAYTSAAAARAAYTAADAAYYAADVAVYAADVARVVGVARVTDERKKQLEDLRSLWGADAVGA